VGKNVKTTIRVDKDVLSEAQSLGINVSKVCDNALRIYVEAMKGAEQRIGTVKKGWENLPLSGPVISGVVEINWEMFRNFLNIRYLPRTVKDRFNYAKSFSHCLTDKNLSELQTLPPDKRGHVLKSLSALAEFLGIYPNWKQLIADYDLKWVGKSRDEIIIDRLTKVTDAGEIFEWVRKIKKARPELSSFMDFITITGLRFEEAIASYNLVIKLNSEGKLSEYYNTTNQTLEHYKFKETFLRRTKKAFISFAPETMIEQLSPISLSKELIIKRIHPSRKKWSLRLRFGDVREAHGTFLTKYLKESEIDFLHGRVSTSVFMRNYFNPALIKDLKRRTNKGISEILKNIQ